MVFYALAVLYYRSSTSFYLVLKHCITLPFTSVYIDLLRFTAVTVLRFKKTLPNVDSSEGGEGLVGVHRWCKEVKDLRRDEVSERGMLHTLFG